MPTDPTPGDEELAGPGSETLDEYRRRVGGDPDAPSLAELLDLTATPVDRDSGRVIWPGEDGR